MAENRQPRPGPPTSHAPLSPACAFVVQFREGADATPARCAGRVEHMSSGHATHFESAEALLAFFARELRKVQTDCVGP